jgi:hypothetical protein
VLAEIVVPDLVRDYLDKPIGKKPSVASQLGAWYAANRPNGDFGVIVKDAWVLSALLERGKARKIRPLPSLVPHARMMPECVQAGSRVRVQYKRMQGTFVTYVAGHPVFIITWGNGKIGGEMAIASQSTFDKLFKALREKSEFRTEMPETGVWEATMAQGRVVFVKKAFDAESSARFAAHPMYKPLEEDAGAFFGNIEWHTRNNQPGMRKVLLTGPPGTGKTSIGFALAAANKDGCAVLYVRDDEDLVAAAEVAASKGRRTIIMAEEVDMLRSPSGRALNWLDGSETPRNPAGTYVVTTTNYPKKIDPRILKRPGRIDRVFAVNALRPVFASAVAASFLGEAGVGLDTRELGRVLDRTTPAEIREIVNLSLRTMAIGESMTVAHIAETRASLKRALSAAGNQEEDDDPDAREDHFKRWGARDDLDDNIPM